MKKKASPAVKATAKKPAPKAVKVKVPKVKSVNLKPGDKMTVIPGMKTIDSGACGMTLRDYFAAAALQGMLASDDSVFANFDEFVKRGGKVAYQYADAMIAAREEAGA
jgi:hypothetical protein